MKIKVMQKIIIVLVIGAAPWVWSAIQYCLTMERLAKRKTIQG